MADAWGRGILLIILCLYGCAMHACTHACLCMCMCACPETQSEFCPQAPSPCEAALAAADIMDAVDSFMFPRPDTWSGGPGLIVAT